MPSTTIAVLIGRDPELRYSVHRGYCDAVWTAGAVPLVLTPPINGDGLARYVEAAVGCDGLLVTGGGDIDPVQYGQPAAMPLMDVDPARDRAELAAIVAAYANGKRVLGICRGAQAVAVALGGTLHQDLMNAGYSGHWEEERQHEPVHEIVAAVGSLAEAALGGAATVNSIHHQAICEPGPELRATAWSADGVIEAVEARDGDHVLGLQWHPERLAHSDERHLTPFRWLAAPVLEAAS